MNQVRPAQRRSYSQNGSTSRQRAAGTTVIGENLAEEVAEPQRQPGKDILLTGGARPAAPLTELGLLDDYRIVVHPVVLGGGQRLFPQAKEL